MNASDRQSEQGSVMLFVVIGMLFLSSAIIPVESVPDSYRIVFELGEVMIGAVASELGNG